MGGKDAETCGRCSMTAVVGATERGDDGDETGTDDRDPFAGQAIEVEESELRAVARPAVWLGRVKRRLDELATRLTYGR